MTARRPIPPVSFRTADLQTLEDLRKLRASQADILTYLDALIAGTGAGTITTVAAGTGISVTNPTGPTATVANTGVLSFNGRTGAVSPVTADYATSYLLRSANDFSTFTAKSNPDNSDLILLEDASAAGVKKYSTLGAITATTDLYLAPPTSANAFDDEFNSGSADLATRGWTFRNMSTGTTMSRVGDVYPYEYMWKAGVGALTANQYRSRIQNGRLALQLSTAITNDYVLYKAVTLPTTTATYGGVVWGRFGSTRGLEAAGAHGYTGVGFYGNSGGFPDLNNRNIHQLNYSGASTVLAYLGFNGGASVSNSISLGDTSPDDTFGIITTASFGTKFFRVDSQSGADSSSALKTGASYKAAGAIAYAGMGFFVPSAAPEQEAAGMRYIDFLRLRTGDMQALSSTPTWLYP